MICLRAQGDRQSAKTFEHPELAPTLCEKCSSLSTCMTDASMPLAVLANKPAVFDKCNYTKSGQGVRNRRQYNEPKQRPFNWSSETRYDLEKSASEWSQGRDPYADIDPQPKAELSGTLVFSQTQFLDLSHGHARRGGSG